MSKTAIVFTDLERGFLEDILYDPISGKLFWKTSSKGRQAGAEIGTFDNGGYLVFQYKYKQYKTHRVAWFLHNKVWPSQIDHINKDRSDNRLINLRDTTTSVNQHNRSMPLPSSGVVGAHYSKKRKNWVASIRLEGKSIFLGSFNCPTAASLAYLKEKGRVLNV